MKIAIAYIPVLHRGYTQFLTSQKFDLLLLLSPEVIPPSIEYLKKDLRAVSGELMVKAVSSLGIVPQVELASAEKLRALDSSIDELVFVDDDIAHAVVETYLPSRVSDPTISFSPIFLRWDKKNATTNNTPNYEQETTIDEFTQKMFGVAYHEAGKSADWWRHVGAVLVKDGQPLLTAFNQHQPGEQQHYIDGDARALFHAGEQIELTSAIHAEASLIAEAARAGLALEGCEMYVTTFPCPPCAKLIVAAGISKLYFAEGYAVFDGETILKAAGIPITKVALDHQTTLQGDKSSIVLSYP